MGSNHDGHRNQQNQYQVHASRQQKVPSRFVFDTCSAPASEPVRILIEKTDRRFQTDKDSIENQLSNTVLRLAFQSFPQERETLLSFRSSAFHPGDAGSTCRLAGRLVGPLVACSPRRASRRQILLPARFDVPVPSGRWLNSLVTPDSSETRSNRMMKLVEFP